jgi:hypothetical protein
MPALVAGTLIIAFGTPSRCHRSRAWCTVAAAS